MAIGALVHRRNYKVGLKNSHRFCENARLYNMYVVQLKFCARFHTETQQLMGRINETTVLTHVDNTMRR